MKAKVRLTYSVEMFVEGKSEEAINDWLNCNTPMTAIESTNNMVYEDFSEEIICRVSEDTIVDYII